MENHLHSGEHRRTVSDSQFLASAAFDDVFSPKPFSALRSDLKANDRDVAGPSKYTSKSDKQSGKLQIPVRSKTAELPFHSSDELATEKVLYELCSSRETGVKRRVITAIL